MNQISWALVISERRKILWKKLFCCHFWDMHMGIRLMLAIFLRYAFWVAPYRMTPSLPQVSNSFLLFFTWIFHFWSHSSIYLLIFQFFILTIPYSVRALKNKIKIKPKPYPHSESVPQTKKNCSPNFITIINTRPTADQLRKEIRSGRKHRLL